MVNNHGHNNHGHIISDGPLDRIVIHHMKLWCFTHIVIFTYITKGIANFANQEKVTMHFIYGAVDRNVLEAQNM